eukprot:741823-Rhodomonas_salina.1
MAEHSKKSGLTFKSKLEDWTSDTEIKILTDLMEKRDAGRVVSCMLASVQQNTVYKNAFGTNFTKHVESGYDTTAKFILAKEIESAFPKAKKNVAMDEHKTVLKEILFSEDNASLQEGNTPKDIMVHHEQQWLNHFCFQGLLLATL